MPSATRAMTEECVLFRIELGWQNIDSICVRLLLTAAVVAQPHLQDVRGELRSSAEEDCEIWKQPVLVPCSLLGEHQPCQRMSSSGSNEIIVDA